MNQAEQWAVSWVKRLVPLSPKQELMLVNSFWLMLDKFLRMGVGLLVNVQITNYIGPSGNGLFNYAVMYVGMFYPLISLGMDTVVVRDLVHNPDNKDAILGTDVRLRLMGAVASMVIGPLLLWYLRPGQMDLMLMAVLQLLTLVFYAADVLELHYQSTVKSKYTVYARNFGFGIATAYKIALLVFGASLPWFVLALTLETGIGVILQYWFYRKQGFSWKLWQYNHTLAKSLLREGLPLMLSGFVILIYTRIDVLMIGQMVSDSEAGIYAAAFRISEIWYFIPFAIIGSVVPALVETYERNQVLYWQKYQRLFDGLIWFSIGAGSVLAFFAADIIGLLYKEAFSTAAGILVWHVWCGLFVAINQAASYHFTYAKATHIPLIKTIIGAGLNVGLNLLWIPTFGGLGAAYATLVSYGVVALPAHLFFKESRPFVWMVAASFNPLRLVKKKAAD